MLSILFVVALMTSPVVEKPSAACVDVQLQRAVETKSLDVRVGTEDGHRTRWVALGQILPGQSRKTFCDLRAGAYTILVRGPEPLQALRRVVVVKPGETTIATVRIPAGRVHGLVTIGGKPLAGATVKFYSSERDWSAEVTTSAKGEIVSGFWTDGDFDVAITGGGLSTARMMTVRIEGFPSARFAIDLPKRELRGRIRDIHGRPVPDAQISLKSVQDHITPMIRTNSDAAGRFTFSALEAGLHTLYVLSKGHLRPEPVEMILTESDEAIEKEIVVDAGVIRPVEVRDDRGEAVASARIFCTRNGRVLSTTTTDAVGRASIATPADGWALLGVFPREGSFLLHRLAAPATDVLRLVMSPANGSLEVAALTTGGEAVPDVSMVIRYNGEFLPPAMTRELPAAQRVMLRTGTDGRARMAKIPSGSYELWPYESDEEADLIVEIAADAPINVNAVRGENKVTVRFDARP